MISIGLDISKEKFTACALEQGGKFILNPYDVDLSRFRDKKCLISFVGIDSPPYESGNFKKDQKKITKRGNSILRKVGYQAMKCMMGAKNPDNEVYTYILKKESKGKAKKVCKFAGLNKFLRMYYARVMEAKLDKIQQKIA